MRNLRLPTLLMILAALAATPAAAQRRATGPMQAPRIMTPPGSVSLSSPSTSPLQQQMKDDYATQLMQEQHELLQRNPSGLTRREVGVNNALNGFTPQ
jgi:hypothetical protein